MNFDPFTYQMPMLDWLKSRAVKRDDIDPSEAKRIEFPCTRCQTGSEIPSYFDAHGNQIPFP